MAESGKWERVVDGREWQMGENDRWYRWNDRWGRVVDGRE